MKKLLPPLKVHQAAARVADAMIDALRRQYTAATSEALLDGNGVAQITRIIEGLATGADFQGHATPNIAFFPDASAERAG